MVEFSLWDILRNLLLAARWTVSLSLIAFIGGGLVGLVLLVLRLSKLRGVDRAVGAYVQVFQGTPLLMQLFLAYFGIALFGIKTSPWTAAAVALTLYTSAYLTEIWRGCVASIPKGQWEAAQSLALNFGEQLRHVVLPQALRMMLPSFINQWVTLVKDSSLAYIVGVPELSFLATQVNARVMVHPAEVFLCVGAVYWLLCSALDGAARRLARASA